MKLLTILVFATLCACSTTKKNKSSNILLNRDCNPNSARLSGKNYVHEDERMNNTKFDQCPQAEDTSYQPYEKRAKETSSSLVGTAIYKCEVEMDGTIFAATNKVMQNAKEKVIEQCQLLKKSKKCLKVKCIEL
jgi:hypothetical protein